MTDTQLTTLADFLLARIAEEEAVAYKSVEDDERMTAQAGPLEDPAPSYVVEQANIGLEYVVGVRPVRVLAECDAKRRIVDLHAVVPAAPLGPNSGLMICLGCGDLAPCMTVRFLALPYVQHPDYQKVWLP